MKSSQSAIGTGEGFFYSSIKKEGCMKRGLIVSLLIPMCRTEKLTTISWRGY
jgi:hypothetical protein